jgi:chromosome segregation ATPase
MKQIITKQDVAQAINSLKTAGKKPTLTAIHAALNNKGSLSTLVKLKAEIESEALDEKDSEEGLKAFRDVWAMAVEEGRQQKENEIAELRQALDAMSAESQIMEGQVAAANDRAKQLETQRDSLVAEVQKANEQVTIARATGEQNANKLADTLERLAKLQGDHSTELSKLRQELADALKKAHETELKLARAEARLEK